MRELPGVLSQVSFAKALQQFSHVAGFRRKHLVPDSILAIYTPGEIAQGRFVFNPTRQRVDYTLRQDLEPGNYLMAWVASATTCVPHNEIPSHSTDQLVPGNFARSLSPDSYVVTMQNMWYDVLMRPALTEDESKEVLSQTLMHYFEVKHGRGGIRSEFSVVGDNHELGGVIVMRIAESKVPSDFDPAAFARASVETVINNSEGLILPSKQRTAQKWDSVLPKTTDSQEASKGRIAGRLKWERWRSSLPGFSEEKNTSVKNRKT